MLTVHGTLHVRAITGRHGVFHIANLTTDIGLFWVKDPELDALEPGLYTGQFILKWIGLSNFPSAQGRMTVEIRATLAGMELDTDNSEVNAQASTTFEEQDPLDETEVPVSTEPVQTSSPALVDNEEVCKETVSNADPEEDAEMAELFGELWPLSNRVKPDATDRARLRKQINVLKKLGYTPDMATQSWAKN